MKINVTFAIAIAGMVTVSLWSHRSVNTPYVDGFYLANIEALTASESTGGTTTTTPPDPWNYVPDRYLISSVKTHKLVCATEGTISVNGVSFSGDYKKGVSYAVVVETKNCNGKQNGAWCDQRLVGSKILSAEDTERS